MTVERRRRDDGNAALRRPVFADPVSRLVTTGYRCWLAGYETGDIAYWRRGFDAFEVKLGARDARGAVSDLANWVRVLRRCSGRKLHYGAHACAAPCRDECAAVGLLAAAQYGACPAMRACAFALTGGVVIDPVVEASRSFAATLWSMHQRFPQEALTPRTAARRPGDKLH
jgi:hypothetical protein